MTIIQDPYGNTKGKVDSGGTVRNFYGQIVGRVSPSGVVTNSNGSIVGYAEAGGSIYDRSRERVGWVAVSYIQDRTGRTVGICDPFDPLSQIGGAALLLLLR